jgi:hypothetical protein
MALYVTLLEGPTPATARAVLASDHPRVIRAVVRALRLPDDRLPTPRPHAEPSPAE